MDGKILKVRIDSLKEVGEEIKLHNDTILENLNSIANTFSGIDECFDSNAGRKYREMMSNMLNKTRDYIDTNNRYLIDKLNEINNEYWQLHENVSKSIGSTGMEKIS